MKYNHIPDTDLKLSLIGLGTMTWGEQNSKQEAYEQMDYALSRGVNFFDTAEMYPVPPRKETCGITEAIIGEWISDRKNRDKIVLATKVIGLDRRVDYIRDNNFLDYDNISKALEGSLKRLKTDYIDLYQLHWPDRLVPLFGTRDYSPDKNLQRVPTPIQETLIALKKLIDQGKIRYIGVSNETPWGLMEFLRISKSEQLPKVVTIQNAYNLLNRTFDTGLSEICHEEKVFSLPYSPLAFGKLSGKYINEAKPKNARITMWNHFSRYNGTNSDLAIEEYYKIAKESGLSLSQISLAWINQRHHVASNLIGATTMEQLKSNIDSININLSGEVRKKIDSIHHKYPNPCP